MVMNLFSVFDPSSYFGVSLNWMIMLLIFMYIPLDYYLVKGSYKNYGGLILYQVGEVFKEITSPQQLALSFLGIIVFLYLMLSNLLGLFPFVFTSTAHLNIVLGLGLVFWLSFFFMGWIKGFVSSAAHLVPLGCPMILSPLMVLIESVSHLIRPFTLSIRLVANMMAGHLIMGLLSSISMVSFLGFFSSLFFQSILLILEFGVAVIQGFVFSILVLLYALEYY